MRKLSQKQLDNLRLGRKKGIQRPKLRGKRPWFIPWNKGIKGIHLSQKTEWKKGVTPKGSKVFVKGHETWNKGKQLPRGKDSTSWRGGRILTQGKYWLIFNPTHPKADGKGYVREHRLVMEKLLGRNLEQWEVVHHINGNTKDNRVKNLMIMDRKTHMLLHKKL